MHACCPRPRDPAFPPLLQVNLFLAVLKHRFAAATSLYSRAVAPEGQPRSTLVLAWLALRARLAAHMATQRSAFEDRISQRSSRSSLSSRSASRVRMRPQGWLG
jgi:hypothetical protein